MLNYNIDLINLIKSWIIDYVNKNMIDFYKKSFHDKMENELKVRSMRPHKVTVQGLDLKKLRTIRWDGTCKKCGVRSYFPRVRVNGIWKLMCILCYWRAKKDV